MNVDQKISKALRVVLLSVATGILGYCIWFHFATARTEKLACAPDAEMQWLKHEFALNDGQFNRIAGMHAAYAQGCDAMCARLQEARNKLQTLLRASDGKVTPEIKSALANASAVELECRQGMLGHIFAVSQVMPAASAERYRRMMEEPILEGSSHHTSLAPEAK